MPQRKKVVSLTFGDRLVTALLGGICAFVTMCLIWFIVMYVGGRRGNDVSMPFYRVWIGTGGVAALAYIAGLLPAFWSTPNGSLPQRMPASSTLQLIPSFIEFFRSHSSLNSLGVL